MIALDHRAIEAHDYALINPLKVDADTWQDLPVERVVPKPFASQPELLPLLLDLNGLDFATRIGLLQRAADWEAAEERPWFAALLASDAPKDRVMRHLARTLAVDQHDGTHDLFRCFAPRVFFHLGWLLTAQQWDQLLGPIAAWTWRAAPGDWRTRERAAPTSVPLRLSREQQDVLLDLGELNACLAQLARVDPTRAQDDAWVQSVRAQLHVAHSISGLDARADRCLYAQQAIRFHPRIHQHPRLQACLEQARSGPRSYHVVCRELDDETLRRLAIELDARKDEA